MLYNATTLHMYNKNNNNKNSRTVCSMANVYGSCIY